MEVVKRGSLEEEDGGGARCLEEGGVGSGGLWEDGTLVVVCCFVRDGGGSGCRLLEDGIQSSGGCSEDANGYDGDCWMEDGGRGAC